ncbi:hypothetical protein [Lichenicoccus sp.]|uniref:hypothetical protein n=1 Tax=Lichenicoccus sp. TaxID=2781899 RepID=UPI003D11E26A
MMEDDCLPGTAGYQKAQEVEQADEDNCQAQGFTAGTTAFLDCRTNEEDQRAERRQAAAAFLYQQAQQTAAPPPAPLFQPALPAPQTVQMNQQTFGNSSYYNGTVGGQMLTGNSQTYGNTTYTHMYGPGGAAATCTRQTFGNNTTTTCQ